MKELMTLLPVSMEEPSAIAIGDLATGRVETYQGSGNPSELRRWSCHPVLHLAWLALDDEALTFLSLHPCCS